MNINPLTDWQRAQIVARVAEGFSSRAQQTLDAALPDESLLELWRVNFPGVPLPSDDEARYAQLVQQMRRAPSITLWREIEDIKNRFGGLVPAGANSTPHPQSFSPIAAEKEEAKVAA